MITVVLQDTLTKGERTLVAKERRGLVLLTRTTFRADAGFQATA